MFGIDGLILFLCSQACIRARQIRRQNSEILVIRSETAILKAGACYKHLRGYTTGIKIHNFFKSKFF